MARNSGRAESRADRNQHNNNNINDEIISTARSAQGRTRRRELMSTAIRPVPANRQVHLNAVAVKQGQANRSIKRAASCYKLALCQIYAQPAHMFIRTVIYAQTAHMFIHTQNL